MPPLLYVLVAVNVLPGSAGHELPNEIGWPPSTSAEMPQTLLPESSSDHHERRLLSLDVLEDAEDAPDAGSEIAYAVVLMDDDDRGARALGQSLIESRTSADLVGILGPRVSAETSNRMKAQGWLPRRISSDSLSSYDREPADMDSASASVLARVSAWALTDYHRVVLLEDNMLVMENVDDLFACTGTCAVMQQAELMSTSVVVLEPDKDMYENMAGAVGNTYCYSEGFQGFLNSYFAGFELCALFEEENPALKDATLLDHSCHRLPTRYNGDLLLVMLNGGLGMVRTKNPMPSEWWSQRRARVVRFDFSGLRPWTWYASPFMPFVSVWEAAYARAGPSDPIPNLVWSLAMCFALTWAVLCLWPRVLRMSKRIDWSRARLFTFSSEQTMLPVAARWIQDIKSRRARLSVRYNPRGLGGSLLHLVAGYTFVLLAVRVGVRQVPDQASVWVSWTVFITWTTTVFGLACSFYLELFSRLALSYSVAKSELLRDGTISPAYTGLNSETTFAARGKGRTGVATARSPASESLVSLLLVAITLAFLPGWKTLSGGVSLGTLLGPVVLAVLLLLVGLTVQMLRLPVLWCGYRRLVSMSEADEMSA